MNKWLNHMLPVVCMLVLFMVGCQAAVQTTQPSPTLFPPTKIPRPVSTEVSTEVPLQTTLDISTQGESKVESIGELDGFWRSGHTKLGIYIRTNTDLNGEAGSVEIYGLPTPGATGFNCVIVEKFTFKDGILTWGDPSFPCMEQGGAWLTWGYEQMWIDNPQAKYELYITYQDGQPETLRFVLVGEDKSQVRQDSLNNKTLTWIGAEAP